MQAYGGLMSINGHPDQPPARVPVSVVDMGTGMWAVMGILAALRERDRTGHGAQVTTALFDTALAWSVFQMSHYFATGEVPRPQGSGTAMIVPYEAFPVVDGWVMIAAGSDALFVKATAALAVPELARDPRFVDNPRRVEHRVARRRPWPGSRGRSPRRSCWLGYSGRACRQRACPPWTRSPPSPRRRRAACSPR